jgi:hypothetical protein
MIDSALKVRAVGPSNGEVPVKRQEGESIDGVIQHSSLA